MPCSLSSFSLAPPPPLPLDPLSAYRSPLSHPCCGCLQPERGEESKRKRKREIKRKRKREREREREERGQEEREERREKREFAITSHGLAPHTVARNCIFAVACCPRCYQFAGMEKALPLRACCPVCVCRGPRSVVQNPSPNHLRSAPSFLVPRHECMCPLAWLFLCCPSCPV